MQTSTNHLLSNIKIRKTKKNWQIRIFSFLPVIYFSRQFRERLEQSLLIFQEAKNLFGNDVTNSKNK